MIPGSGRSPGEGNGNPLQYSCLGNSMDRGTLWPTVYGTTRVRHNLMTEHTHMHYSIPCWSPNKYINLSECNINLFVDPHQYVLHVISASLENQIKSHITKCFESHGGKDMGNVQWSSCNTPNIYITLKSMCLNPNLQCDNIRRWHFGNKSRSWR